MPTPILMPALSPTMEEGKLARWLVKEGDSVKPGDILAEIETDKATMEFETIDEGRIEKILVPEGTAGVKVNTPIAMLAGEGEDTSALPKSKSRSPLEGEPSSQSELGGGSARSAAKPLPEALRASTLPQGEGERNARVFASPLARAIAKQKGIELSTIAGSGPRGRIVKADIERITPIPHPEERAAGVSKGEGVAIAPLPDARLFYRPEDYVEIPHDLMRKSIARRLSSAAATIPHFYLTIDCTIDELLAARARLNDAAPRGDGAYRLSVNDFLVKAAALALMRVPEVNASWTETAILRHKHADVGVAVAIDFGLITPIVFRAEEKGLAEISNEIRSLAKRARARKLKPQEYEGGGFAVSNLGMYGIKHFTAVINPPHAGILAVGEGRQRAIVAGGKLAIATVMTVTMSCDHRVIDGATGARFLQVFKQFVEEPAAMLL